MVEIVTSDMVTGQELGRTQWSGKLLVTILLVTLLHCVVSGPGTLTLSSISAAVNDNINSYNKIKRKASPGPYGPVSDDVEIFTVPEEHREENQHFTEPPPIIGSPCTSQYNCAGALRAVCARDNTCQVTLIIN